MLILKRNVYEKVYVKVGEIEIVVTIVEILNSATRLGFEAPSHVIIDREEVYQAKKNEAQRRLV